MKSKLLYIIPALMAVAALVVACTKSAGATTPAGTLTCADVTCQQVQMQQTTGKYMKQLTSAQPYPLSAMTDSAERANLRARLIRLNDPNRIGYFYEMSQTGQVIAFYTIRGKVSSTGSQLSNPENAIGYAGSHDVGGTVVSSPGDDGSFGPEECQSQGVFFFTADTDALVEWCGAWQYSDAPLKLATAPIITTSGQAPTSPVPVGGSSKK